ncbi:flagellar hook assembly protein FlgD [Desulfogranum mediterraneum]|uniref:flagellar hook assembly protein FlgD n=1 Tax=Desulfogranum mediterraneum TaxID=160661 RepID=UPI00040663B9|nr:flagellar hook capping FlgD N-terminal domain-containing protein [Desulfogranum mediterraneum]
MAEIPGITSPQATTTPATTADKKKDALGQEQFLTLLVAQLKNQDPLNPTDATEFTAQLAQYSQLEQLFSLNSSMEQLADAQNNSQRISALSLIGKEVLVEGSKLNLGSSPVEIGYKVKGQVSGLELQIKNSSGATVATLQGENLKEGNHSISWNGLDREGNPLPPGSYTVTAQVQTEDKASKATVTPLVRTQVTGVNLEGAAPMLVTASGEFSIDAIQGAFDTSQQSDSAKDQPTEGGDQADGATTTDKAISAAKDGAGIIEGTKEGTEEETDTA